MYNEVWLVDALEDRKRSRDREGRHRHCLAGLDLGHQLAGPDELVLVERALWQLGVDESPHGTERPDLLLIDPGLAEELEGRPGRQPVIALDGLPEVLVGRQVDQREPELGRDRRERLGLGPGRERVGIIDPSKWNSLVLHTKVQAKCIFEISNPITSRQHNN